MSSIINMDLESFLSELKLSEYLPSFQGEGYDEVSDVIDMSQSELEGIGMKKGHLKRLLKKINAMKQHSPSSAPAGSLSVDEKEDVSAPEVPIRRQPKKKVSLLLFGETGVGKSTLLQSLGDYIDGVPYGQHKKTEKIVEEKGASQTQESGLLNFNNSEWNVDIIDTPGLGDTRGMSVDESHISNLQGFLANKEFNAVCILIKRGTTRSVALLNYVVNELKANMPKTVAEHFIVVMTRAEVPIPDDDTLGVIEKLDLPIDNIIPVNNIAYEDMDLTKWKKDDKGSRAGRQSTFLQNIERRRQRNYEENHEYLQQLLDLAYSFEPYQGNQVVELKVKRDTLRERVQLLTTQIGQGASLQTHIQEQRLELRAARGDMARAKAAIIKSETWTEKVPYKDGTIQTVCRCGKVCHIDCGLSHGDDLTGCAAMNGSTCSVCGCSPGNHTHFGWKFTVETHVREVTDDLKVQEMNSAQAIATAAARRERQFERQLADIQRKQEEATLEIRALYTQLDQIAILGWNDSYEKYMLECQKAVEQDENLTGPEKEAKLGIFAQALAKINVFKDAVSDIIGLN